MTSGWTRWASSRGAFLETDEQLRVPGRPWLYALGDVNGRALLTHMGKYQARVVADATGGGTLRATRDDTGARRVVFTSRRSPPSA